MILKKRPNFSLEKIVAILERYLANGESSLFSISRNCSQPLFIKGGRSFLKTATGNLKKAQKLPKKRPPKDFPI